MSAYVMHGTQKCVAKTSPGMLYCCEPCEYLTRDQARAEGFQWSGWYHVDRSLTADHHAIPESMIY
jgi:hypothetical protein